MKKFSLKNVLILLKFELKKNYKSIIIWTIALSLVMLLYLSIYPSVKDMMTEKFESLPDELLSFFGSDSTLSDINSYFAMILHIISLVISGYAITFSCSIVHDEEFNKNIDFLDSECVSRHEILISKLMLVFISIFFIYLAILIVSQISATIVEPNTFNNLLTFKALCLSSIVSYTFACIGIFIASILPKNIKSTGVTLGLFFLLYLLGYISSLNVDALSFFKWLSPIEYVTASDVVNGESIILGYILNIIIIIVSFILANYLYNKKNF